MEVHFSWTQYLTLTFNFAHTQGMFSQKTTILPDGRGQLQWTNFGTCTTHGGNLSLTEIPIVPKYNKDENGTKTLQGAWLALTVNAGWYHFLNKSYELKQDGTPSKATAAGSGQDGYPHFPYHGKVEAGKTLSQLASTTLGWDASVWDFSGDTPVFKK